MNELVDQLGSVFLASWLHLPVKVVVSGYVTIKLLCLYMNLAYFLEMKHPWGRRTQVARLNVPVEREVYQTVPERITMPAIPTYHEDMYLLEHLSHREGGIKVSEWLRFHHGLLLWFVGREPNRWRPPSKEIEVDMGGGRYLVPDFDPDRLRVYREAAADGAIEREDRLRGQIMRAENEERQLSAHLGVARRLAQDARIELHGNSRAD